MSSAVARLTVMCTGFVILWPILAGSGHAAVDPESIVAIWTFEEGRGEDVKDVSGNGNDGVVLGKPRWVNGKFGTALSLDGQGNVSRLISLATSRPRKK